MTVLARSFSAAVFNAASAPARSEPSISMSKTLPWRTLATELTPSDRNAPSMALPCGSRIPDFSVTVTRAFMRKSIHQVARIERKRNPGAMRNLVAQARMSRCSLRATFERSALDQDRAGALRPLAFAHDAEAFGHFGIGFQQSAEIAAEAVLVELLVRLDIPQPAGIRRYLVGDDDPHHVVFPQPAGLHLEIDKADAAAEEQAGQEVVDADRERHDVVDLLRRRPAERSDMLFRHHRIVELIVLVIELDDRTRQLRAFLDSEPLRQRARSDIAHADFERNDLNLANKLLAHIEAADEVGRNS